MSKTHRIDDPNSITWLQVHNIVPLIGMLIAAIGVFNLVSNKVELLSQRTTYLESQVNSCSARANGLERAVNDQALKIQTIQAKYVQGAQTVRKVTPTPTKGVEKK